MPTKQKLISLIIPCYNEEENISVLYKEIQKFSKVLHKKYSLEILFIDDGSKDNTILEIKKIKSKNQKIKLIEFSRNFGKEIATTAGINNCSGDSCVIVDADLQYPIEILSNFIQLWENGVEVVIGIRNKKQTNNIIEKIGSRLFYFLTSFISQIDIKKGALDFRLIDRKVIEEFNKFTEHGRMTRALIDWLGFKRDYIYYDEKPRKFGNSSFSFLRRFQLAFNTLVVTSLLPLRIAGLLGLFISTVAAITGIYVVLQKYILETNWGLSITGSASLGIFNLFLTGLLLICIGLIALYIEFIHIETLNRPLYTIRKIS
jgi:polyisoprenyl-phosphate glycosyltransferase